MRLSWQQQLWADLHTRAATTTAPDPEAEWEWLREFDRRIHCDHCRRHWREIVAAHPPDFRTARTYFRWTVRAHNAINDRLGKRLMPFAEACALWSFDNQLPLT